MLNRPPDVISKFHETAYVTLDGSIDAIKDTMLDLSTIRDDLGRGTK
ncbi:hypothetical protein X727_07990 [Mesorhizobium sp. L103C119B0]|nr:hypothetical protein X727_07990 [Mesorhizobium sp. L103C119B0]